MRRGLAATLVLTTVVTVAACGGDGNEAAEPQRPRTTEERPAAVPAGWRTMVNERTRVQFAFPPSWRRKGPLLAEDGRGAVCGLDTFVWKEDFDGDVMALARAAAKANERGPQESLDLRADRVAGGPAGRFEVQGSYNGITDPGPIATVAVVDFGALPDALHCNGSFHDRYEKNKATFEQIVATLAPAGAR